MELFEAFPFGETGVALPFFFLLGVTLAVQSSSSLVSLWYVSYKRNIAA